MSEVVVNSYRFESFPASSNPLAWFDGTDVSTITKAGGGGVSVWADKMGTSAYNLTQPTTAKRPTWLDDNYNGRDVISFANEEYMFKDFGVTIAQPYTIATAWVFAENDTQERVGYDSKSGGDRALFIKNSTSNSWRIHAGADLSFTDATIPATWGYTVGIFNGVNSEARVNGVSVASGDAGSSSYEPMTLAHRHDAGGNSDWEQKIMHVLIYDKAVTGSELTALESWLGNEVGL